MSSVVKVALPILGGIVGSIIPGIGTAAGAALGGAVGGYIGGRSYGGGNRGGLIGAAGGAAGGYLSGGYGASDWLSGLGSGATDGAATGTSSSMLSSFGEGGSAALGDGAAIGGTTGSAADGLSAGGGFTDVIGDSAASGMNASGTLSSLGDGSVSSAGSAGGMGWEEGPTPASLDGSNPSMLDRLRMFQGSKGAVRGEINLGTSLYGLAEANRLRSASDPFGKYRADYAAKLAALEANPSSVTTLPGYQAGLQAVERAGAAQGYTGSGNMGAALAGYGQQFFQQQASQLAGFGGAGAPVGQGAAAGYVADNNAFKGIGNGLGSYFGG